MQSLIRCKAIQNTILVVKQKFKFKLFGVLKEFDNKYIFSFFLFPLLININVL